MLGKLQEAGDYKKIADQVKKAYNATFFNDKTKQYAGGSQTANAVSVYMGLVAPENKAAVIENIVKELKSRNNTLKACDIGCL